MKKYLNIYLFILLLSSCKINLDEQGRISHKSSRTNGIDDQSEFIGKHRTKVAILGVFHFDNPGLDDYKPKYSVDILSNERQGEIGELIEKLVEYAPTKILVEIPREEGDSLINLEFERYLQGQFDISKEQNEIYQLAFPLAKKLGHNRIYASDAKNSKWFGADLDWENYDATAYMQKLNQYDKANRYDYEGMYAYHDSLKIHSTLLQHLTYINQPRIRLKDHQAYLTNHILTGAGDLYIGADAVARWYQRNLKIFANAYDLADFEKEDKLLLIYGSGHVWQLRQLFMDSPDFEYIEINKFL